MTQPTLRAIRGAVSSRPCIHARTLLCIDTILTASKLFRISLLMDTQSAASCVWGELSISRQYELTML